MKKAPLKSGDFAIVDDEDYDKIIKRKWHQDAHGYAVRKHGRMHRDILQVSGKKIIDHINGNILDNRKANLRICTKTENGQHRIKLPKHNTSGFLGIRQRKGCKTWQARITVNGQEICLGSFADVRDAIGARRKAEQKYFGDFAPYLLWEDKQRKQ